MKHECLDHFVVFGEGHLRHLVREFMDYYHRWRPHQALGNLPPAMEKPPDPIETIDPGQVVVHERLGGLLKHYERRAA